MNALAKNASLSKKNYTFTVFLDFHKRYCAISTEVLFVIFNASRRLIELSKSTLGQFLYFSGGGGGGG